MLARRVDCRISYFFNNYRGREAPQMTGGFGLSVGKLSGQKTVMKKIRGARAFRSKRVRTRCLDKNE